MASDRVPPAPPPGPAVPPATDGAAPPPALLPQVLPALVVGVGAGLLFLAVSFLSEEFQEVLWDDLPGALGVDGHSSLWIVALLTATGVAVGLVVWKAPGHAGPDPATTGLGGPPLAAGVVPGLLLAGVLALAGGVSLGPENPIIATNVALAYWLGRRAAPAVPGAAWAALASAATIGALFGTPVAAALVISEALAARPGPGSLWDRLFAPLVAAGAGAMTTQLLAGPSFALGLPPLTDPGWADLLAALVIAAAAALFGLAACFLLPRVHAAFRRLRHPMLMLPVGGLVLGLLGALGGPLTLFKGLAEVKELTSGLGGWSSAELAKLAVVKLLALLVASSCGFRGGRIFPAVFVGTAFGLLAQALVTEVRPAVAVSSAVLGVLLATTRQGWISLFTAAVLVASPATLALLCLATLPAWLLVSGRPQLELDPQGKSLR